MLNGVDALKTEGEKKALIEKNISNLQKTYKREDWQNVMIRTFYEGNQYMLFVTESFEDVRLVGAPPSSIGKFGSDTDTIKISINNITQRGKFFIKVVFIVIS